MKIETFKKRAEKNNVRAQSTAYQTLFSLLNGVKRIYPNISTKRRYDKRTDDIIDAARKMNIGITVFHNYEISPLGGIEGIGVKLNSKGMRQRFK